MLRVLVPILFMLWAAEKTHTSPVGSQILNALVKNDKPGCWGRVRYTRTTAAPVTTTTEDYDYYGNIDMEEINDSSGMRTNNRVGEQKKKNGVDKKNKLRNQKQRKLDNKKVENKKQAKRNKKT